MSKILQLLGFFGLIICIALITVVAVVTLSLGPINSAQTETQSFVIAKGQGTISIGNKLSEAGLIRNPLIFRLVVRQQGLSSQLQSGTFELSPTMSVLQIAQVLTQGTEDLWITVLEGWRTEEIAGMLSRQELPLFDEVEFMKLAKPSEGYLFPDTYLVPKQSTAAQLYQLLTTTFDRKIEKGLAVQLNASQRSMADVITMASLVQREAQSEEDMRHVAGILWNRYDINMPLQVDATLQYVAITKAESGKWWTPPSAADKAIVSPYNTYLNTGLPPYPIANPGLTAVKAAAEPIVTEDLFYIHDRQGLIHYATTYEQHQKNIDLYLR